jgi:hypothetical protein
MGWSCDGLDKRCADRVTRARDEDEVDSARVAAQWLRPCRRFRWNMLLGIEPLGDMQQRDDTRTVYAADRELQSRSRQRYCSGQYPGVKRIDGTTARACTRRYGTALHRAGTALRRTGAARRPADDGLRCEPLSDGEDPFSALPGGTRSARRRAPPRVWAGRAPGSAAGACVERRPTTRSDRSGERRGQRPDGLRRP